MNLAGLKNILTGSVRRQLILSVALVHALMMGLFIWDLTARQSAMILEQQISQARSLTQSVAVSAGGWLASRDLTGLQEIIDAQKGYPEVLFAMALDRDGLVLAHTDPARRGQFVTDIPVRPQVTALHSGPKLVDIISPAMVAGQHVGWVRVGVGQHASVKRIAALSRDGVGYALVAILVGVIIAFLIGSRLTRRLNAIRETAEAVSAGQPDRRAPEGGADEAAQLAHCFNQMLDELALRDTEMRNSYQALRNSERLLQQSQEIAHLGSWELNLANNDLSWSDEVYQIFGWKPQEFPATYDAFMEVVHPDDRQRVNNAYLTSLEQKRDGYEIEHRIIRHGTGEIRFVYEKCQHFRDDAGNIIRSLGMVHDITETKRTEIEREKLQAQLLQSQKMESIGLLTGGIAHDFNNMLGAILGYAELIKQTTSPTPDPENHTPKYVDEILTAGNRAKELIAQMLLFSRLSPDTREGDAPTTPLKPVAKEVVHMLRSSIPSSIEVSFDIDNADLQARILPVHLHQILLNLVINARDAIGEYGRIDVALSQTLATGTCNACHATFDGEYVELSVHDSGKGIPDHSLNKVFDPFFTTKAVGKGSGMGLSVVHGIVHALGGHVTVESVPNQGTTIRVLLPAVSAESVETAKVVAPLMELADSALSGLRIMVVDDEQAIASMLQELLNMHGAIVSAYNQPHEALTAFLSDPGGFDLVITDETMPGLTGLDMARDMLKMQPDLPVILCTGYSEQVNADIARKNGIAAFMHKPLEINALLHSIQELRPGRTTLRDMH